MFGHIFLYTIKQQLSEKSVVFWLIVFPIFMAVLFHAAFSNIQDETLETIPAAAVVTVQNSDFLTAAEQSGMFEITQTDAKTAQNLLDTGKVDVILNVGEDISLTVGTSGLNQSVAAVFADTYRQTVSTLGQISVMNPDALHGDALKNLTSDEELIHEESVSVNGDPFAVLYYALIAMSCFMAATISVSIIARLQANQSALAARINCAPPKKLKIFSANLLASFTMQCIYNYLLVLFIWKVLGVDFGKNLVPILGVVTAGCFAGITFGCIISVLTKFSEGMKSGILIAFTLTGCFFAGMMSTDVVYIVKTQMPWLEKINPISRISDSLYLLYYYGVNQQYYRNLIFLVVLGLVCILGTVAVLRVQRYQSVSGQMPEEDS